MSQKLCKLCELKVDTPKFCRSCGNCICCDCSNLKLRKAGKPVRVCVRCYDSIIREYSNVSRIPQSELQRLVPLVDEYVSEDEQTAPEMNDASYLSSISSYLVNSWFSPTNTTNETKPNSPSNTTQESTATAANNPKNTSSATSTNKPSSTSSASLKSPMHVTSPVVFSEHAPSSSLYLENSSSPQPQPPLARRQLTKPSITSQGISQSSLQGNLQGGTINAGEYSHTAVTADELAMYQAFAARQSENTVTARTPTLATHMSGISAVSPTVTRQAMTPLSATPLALQASNDSPSIYPTPSPIGNSQSGNSFSGNPQDPNAPPHPRARRTHPRAISVVTQAHPLSGNSPMSPVSSHFPESSTPVALTPTMYPYSPAHIGLSSSKLSTTTPNMSPMMTTNVTNVDTPTSHASSPSFTLVFPIDSPELRPLSQSPADSTASTVTTDQSRKKGQESAVFTFNTAAPQPQRIAANRNPSLAPSTPATTATSTQLSTTSAPDLPNKDTPTLGHENSSHTGGEELEPDDAADEDAVEEDFSYSYSLSYYESDEDTRDAQSTTSGSILSSRDATPRTTVRTLGNERMLGSETTPGSTVVGSGRTPYSWSRSLRRGNGTPRNRNRDAFDDDSIANSPNSPEESVSPWKNARDSGEVASVMRFEEDDSSCVEDHREATYTEVTVGDTPAKRTNVGPIVPNVNGSMKILQNTDGTERGKSGNTVVPEKEKIRLHFGDDIAAVEKAHDHDVVSSGVSYKEALVNALHDDSYFSAPSQSDPLQDAVSAMVPAKITSATSPASDLVSPVSPIMKPESTGNTPNPTNPQPPTGSFTLPSSDVCISYYSKYCRVHPSEKILAIIPKCAWNSGGSFPTSIPLAGTSSSSLPTGSIFSETTVATWRRVRTLHKVVTAVVADLDAVVKQANPQTSIDTTPADSTNIVVNSNNDSISVAGAISAGSAVAMRTYRTILRSMHTPQVTQLLSLQAGTLLVTTHQCLLIPVWLAVLHLQAYNRSKPATANTAGDSQGRSCPPLSILALLLFQLRLVSVLTHISKYSQRNGRLVSGSSSTLLNNMTTTLTNWSSILLDIKTYVKSLLRVLSVPNSGETTMKMEPFPKDACLLTIESNAVPYTRYTCVIESCSHPKVKEMIRVAADAANKPLRALHSVHSSVDPSPHLPAFSSRDDVMFVEAKAMMAITTAETSMATSQTKNNIPGSVSSKSGMAPCLCGSVCSMQGGTQACVDKQEVMRLRAITLINNESWGKLFFRNSLSPMMPCLGRLSHLAFWRANTIAGHAWCDLYAEYRRLGLCGTDSAYRLTEINLSLDVCPSYPRLVAVAKDIDDATIAISAKYRTMQRWPAVCWAWAPALLDTRLQSTLTDKDGAGQCQTSKESKEEVARVWPVNGAVLMRSAQPCCGLSGARCGADEVIVRENVVANWRKGRLRHAGADGHADDSSSLSTTNVQSSSAPGWDMCADSDDRLLTIIDARPRVNANAQALKGGGTESPSYYSPGHFPTTLHFMDMPNIHAARKAHNALKALCKQVVRDASVHDHTSLLPFDISPAWLHEVSRTGYLDMIASSLRAASYVAQLLLRGSSVLVHCTDGWDRTPTLTSLAQLMLDPYYRTLPGLIVLVEKEWVQFGHKFASRCGSSGGSSDDNERSPTFVMFLDAVYQLMKQHASAFEYSQDVLYYIIASLTTGQYGTFLNDNNLQRHEYGLPSCAASLWTDIHAKRHLFRNETYVHSVEPIFPQLGHVTLWCELYLRQLHSMSHASMALRSESMLGEHIFLIPDEEKEAFQDTIQKVVVDNGDLYSAASAMTATEMLLLDSVHGATQDLQTIGSTPNRDDMLIGTISQLFKISDRLSEAASMASSCPPQTLFDSSLSAAYTTASPTDGSTGLRTQTLESLLGLYEPDGDAIRADRDIEESGKERKVSPTSHLSDSSAAAPQGDDAVDSESIDVSDLQAVIELQQRELERLRAECEAMKKELRNK